MLVFLCLLEAFLSFFTRFPFFLGAVPTTRLLYEKHNSYQVFSDQSLRMVCNLVIGPYMVVVQNNELASRWERLLQATVRNNITRPDVSVRGHV